MFLDWILQSIIIEPPSFLPLLHLPHFIVKHFSSTRYLSREFDKVLVGRVFVYVVVAVFFILKLDNESVG